MAYKVQIQYDDPMPECCSDCRFNYDFLYCELDDDKQVTVHEDEGRPQHCKLMLTVDVREFMASAWIPVTERLPDEQTTCLISTDTEVVCEAVYRDGFFHCYGKVDDTMGVLAWMPMPESFKP